MITHLATPIHPFPLVPLQNFVRILDTNFTRDTFKDRAKVSREVVLSLQRVCYQCLIIFDTGRTVWGPGSCLGKPSVLPSSNWRQKVDSIPSHKPGLECCLVFLSLWVTVFSCPVLTELKDSLPFLVHENKGKEGRCLPQTWSEMDSFTQCVLCWRSLITFNKTHWGLKMYFREIDMWSNTWWMFSVF